MAKVPLRKYVGEIETLTEGGRTDEAIAHCRHILKTFPKYLEIYRLLGKACLESRRHSDAADIFNRVLMAAPDDFVSHVGLSILADEARRQDEAIWHMERAFEKQPSNAAIQAELQRLYGRRDGREPAKIRLTRGALAHMYYQGELYTQAIAEIRSVMAEDASRVDLQSLLALVYFRNGQKVEASEACTRLLDQFPYHFDANRILVEILPGTGLADSAGEYRKRVVELDPYAAYASGSIFRSEEAPSASVVVERLEYTGQAAETGAVWSGALSMAEGKPVETEPDWMSPGQKAEPAFPSAPAFHDDFETPPAVVEAGAPAPAESQPAAAEDDIPEWMRAAGWGASTGAFDESAASAFQEEPAAEGLEKADLPDWIKSMAPPAPEPAAPSIESVTPDAEMTDWLNKLGGEHPFDAAASEPQTPAEQAGQPAEVPDWLAGFKFTETPAPAADSLDWLDEMKSPAETPAPAAEVPAWLDEMKASVETPAPETSNWLDEMKASIETPAPTADSFDWLDETKEPKAEQPSALPLEPAAPAAAAELADWLSTLDEPAAEPLSEPAQTPPAAPVPMAGLGELGASAAEQDAALAWLESLAAKQGAKPEELITDPNARLEKPPEWVEQAKIVGESRAEAPVPAPEQPVVWPRGMGQEESQPEPPAPEQPAARMDDFVQEAELLPAETTSQPAEEAPAPVSDTDAWLRGLEAEEFKAEEPVQAEPAPWSGEIEITPPVQSSAEPAAQADLPAWLRDFSPNESETLPARAEELPDWLKGEGPEAPIPPVRTRAADWTPEAPKPVPPPAPKPERKSPAPRAAAAKSQPAPEPAPAEPAKTRKTGMLTPVVDPALASARSALTRGKIPDALQYYGNLIRRGKLLEDITFDLKEALYRFPVEVSIWQALGDAYMRANRLQDALDAYTKAEELLR